MTKERIVIETNGGIKSALASSLDAQGLSISEWFEEQISFSLDNSNADDWNTNLKAKSLIGSKSGEEIFDHLSNTDWSFTSDNTQFLSHDIHPYPAKFIPQIPSALISSLSLPGDIILDPFGGSGTTAMESIRLGRQPISIDANPLSSLIGRVKTGFLDLESSHRLKHLESALKGRLNAMNSGREHNDTELYSQYVPTIPNMEKWFSTHAISELALIRYLIEELTNGFSEDVANLTLSKIILRTSNQDSETRYVSRDKNIQKGFALKCFLDNLASTIKKLQHSASHTQYAKSKFFVGDSRSFINNELDECSVDLVVTSPPYPNATDYHLYHRFRLFWLGFDPREFAKVEIGSHLKHQRNSSGFEEYHEDMRQCIEAVYRVLRPGRFAIFIVGDALFKGNIFDTAKELSALSEQIGFKSWGAIERPIHQTKRSFAGPARRARTEKLMVLQRPDNIQAASLVNPNYKMWPYEKLLQSMEIKTILASKRKKGSDKYALKLDDAKLFDARRLTFTSAIEFKKASPKFTWQAILESNRGKKSNRKQSKYVTHGLHNYKGKFYPQLAKSLLNIAGAEIGSNILDPFCGSGTVPLECFLNGLKGHGLDMNPLAAKISIAKCQILTLDRVLCEPAILSILEIIDSAPKHFKRSTNEFDDNLLKELFNWFPEPVIYKLNWIKNQIGLFGDPVLQNFFEVVLSSIIRDVSQQSPKDLRIRRRAEPIIDAPVLELFSEKLTIQLEKLIHYWNISSSKPFPSYRPEIHEVDNRKVGAMDNLFGAAEKIHSVVTSPPYATALPYIDTDRLSLLAIMGIQKSDRTVLEQNLTGSREIVTSDKKAFEEKILSGNSKELTPLARKTIEHIYKENKNDGVGFRRQNMPSLLYRYFNDMEKVLINISQVMRKGGEAFFVVGNSRTKVSNDWYEINTINILSEIAEKVGFKSSLLMDISVTTENYLHQKNAITSNAILKFKN